jgi:prepilin-type N-terminal cleavage/methylation domain-containing protein
MVLLSMRKNKGFTLLEMMTVIAILGIVSAIAIPNYFSWLSDMKIKTAVGDLKSDMNMAKLRAIRENATVAMVFNIASNSYETFVDNGTGGGTANNWVRDGGEVQLKLATLPAGVNMREVSFVNDRCSFNGSGIPSGLVSVPNTPDVYMENTKHKFRGISLSLVGTVRIMTRENSGASWEYW